MTPPAAPDRPSLSDRLEEPRVADPRARRARLVLSVVMVLGGLTAFARVWDWWTESENLSRWDVPVLLWLAEHRSPALTVLLEVVTTVTAPAGMVVISVVTVILWLWRSPHWWPPVLLAGAMATAVACIVGIKAVAARGRPPVADMLMGADASYSFPSGHTLATATFVSVLVYLLHFRPRPLTTPDPGVHADGRSPRALPARGARWWTVLAGLAVVTVVAFSRLYLGYHWLTDVTASLVLAVTVLGAVLGLDAWRPTARLEARDNPDRAP